MTNAECIIAAKTKVLCDYLKQEFSKCDLTFLNINVPNKIIIPEKG